MPRMYEEFAEWWPLLSAPAGYEEEATFYRDALLSTATGPVRTLLELGSGGGNNASHMKSRFEMVLVEPAAGMRAVSQRLNPECEHVLGDMRTLRLGRTFDVVFVHDAVAYMTSEEMLADCMSTAHAHLRPGGVAIKPMRRPGQTIFDRLVK